MRVQTRGRMPAWCYSACMIPDVQLILQHLKCLSNLGQIISSPTPAGASHAVSVSSFPSRPKTWMLLLCRAAASGVAEARVLAEPGAPPAPGDRGPGHHPVHCPGRGHHGPQRAWQRRRCDSGGACRWAEHQQERTPMRHLCPRLKLPAAHAWPSQERHAGTWGDQQAGAWTQTQSGASPCTWQQCVRRL